MKDRVSRGEMALKRFGVIIEGDEKGYSAFAPDLPGCVGAGETLDETRRDIESAIVAHVHWLIREGEPVPEPRDIVLVEIPSASVTFVEIEVPEAKKTARG
jgi:predicted RNase H-like HicB family nuclease